MTRTPAERITEAAEIYGRLLAEAQPTQDSGTATGTPAVTAERRRILHRETAPRKVTR